MGERPDIAFATVTDAAFAPGAVALARSVRRFYTPAEAEVYALATGLDQPSEKALQDASVHVIGLPRNLCPRQQGKAASVVHAMTESAASKVLHIDSDAWLTARLDPLFNSLAPGMVVACDDYEGYPPNINAVRGFLGYEPPPMLPAPGWNLYRINAGIVALGKSPATIAMAEKWLHACATMDANGNNQAILRALIAAEHLAERIKFVRCEDARHWNPIWYQGDAVYFKGGEWRNGHTHKRQYLMHAAGGKGKKIGGMKPWQTPELWTEQVLACWRWAYEEGQ